MKLLIGRKIKTTLPTLEVNLQQQWPDREIVWNKNKPSTFNKHHSARPLPSLEPGDQILIKLDHHGVDSSKMTLSTSAVHLRVINEDENYVNLML